MALILKALMAGMATKLAGGRHAHGDSACPPTNGASFPSREASQGFPPPTIGMTYSLASSASSRDGPEGDASRGGPDASGPGLAQVHAGVLERAEHPSYAR